MSVDVSPDNQWITFDLLGHIYRTQLSGGRAKCLTCGYSQSINYHPRISPDGKYIAYISDRNGQNNLWISNTDGSESRVIFFDLESRITEPAWSANGKAIFATRRFRTSMGFYRVRSEIWKFHTNGSLPEAVVKSGGLQRHWPSLSSDGEYVYFYSMNSAGRMHTIARKNLKTGHTEQVGSKKTRVYTYPTYSYPLGEVAPEVSPDGKYLAFVRKIPAGKVRLGNFAMEGRSALWLRDLTTGRERVLVDPVTSDAMNFLFTHKARVFPGYAWSSDSSFIVISTGGKIRRVNVSDGEISNIAFRAKVDRVLTKQARYVGRLETESTFTPRTLRWPSLSPDGQHLLFEAAGQVYVWDLDSDSVRLLAPMPTVSQGMASWSKDGKKVIFATWEDDGKGGLHQVEFGSGEAVPVVAPKSEYAYPHWSNGKLLVSMRSQNTPWGQSQPDNSWMLVEIMPSGKIGKSKSGVGPLLKPVLAADADTHYFETIDGPKGDTRELLAAGKKVPGSISRAHLISREIGNGEVLVTISGEAFFITPSPDLKWIAFQRFEEIYIAKVENGILIDVLNAEQGVGLRKLSTSGGGYPHWVENGRLGFVSGTSYVTYDLNADKYHRRNIPIKIARNTGNGNIVLAGGTVLVGDQNFTRHVKSDVHIKDDRIVCVGKCVVPKSARYIRVNGKFIIPGWVDVHTHHLGHNPDVIIRSKKPSSAAYLAYGVTTTSDPGGRKVDRALALSDMSDSGHIVGPRSLTQGNYIRCSGSAPGWSSARKIETLADAKAIVERHKRWGATLLKSYQLCTRSEREMLVRAARDAGLGATVEAQDLNLLLSATIDGYAGWEHWLQYLPIYSDVSRFFGKAEAHNDGQIYQAGYPNGGSTEYWVAHSDWWMNAKMRRFQPWRVLATRRAPSGKSAENFSWPILAKGSADIVREGGFAPVGGHSELPGIDTHWEVWALASVMGEAAALRAASYHGAHFLGFDRDIGTIEAGKIADLMILSKNPLEDIKNTTSISEVMSRGVLYDASNLNEIWPTKKSYGEYPWVETVEIFISDTRSE